MQFRAETLPAATAFRSSNKVARSTRLPEYLSKTLLAVAALVNAGARGEDPKPETLPPEAVLPDERSDIPSGFQGKLDLVLHWKRVKEFLEELTIEGGEGRREYGKETIPQVSAREIEEIWLKKRDMQKKIFEEQQTMHVQEGRPLPIISYPHAHGSLTVENRENKSTFIVTVKPETTNRVFSIDASWNLEQEQTQFSNTQMHDGGCIRFELKDRNGTIYEGRTGSNGVAILKCENVAFPCVMRFLEATEPAPEVRTSTRNSLIEEFGGLVELNDT